MVSVTSLKVNFQFLLLPGLTETVPNALVWNNSLMSLVVLYVDLGGWFSLGVVSCGCSQMAAGTGVSWRFTFGLDVQNSSSQGCPLRLAVSWCPAGAMEGSTDPWLLPVAWAPHSWVLRKSSPIAHISRDPGGSCKVSYGLPCLTSALFCWSNFTRVKYKEPWFTGSLHLWRLAPISVMKIASRTLNGSLSSSSGSWISFWLHKDLLLLPLTFWLFAF